MFAQCLYINLKYCICLFVIHQEVCDRFGQINTPTNKIFKPTQRTDLLSMPYINKFPTTTKMILYIKVYISQTDMTGVSNRNSVWYYKKMTFSFGQIFVIRYHQHCGIIEIWFGFSIVLCISISRLNWYRNYLPISSILIFHWKISLEIFNFYQNESI